MSDTKAQTMTGAEALVKTLANNGVDACFANPGTSEMHLVTALDKEPRIRSVLCLFEGVATGAADGYARVTGKPAMTLLHLGPGYMNGGANIHNALKAGMPMINVIGDHAVPHLQYEAPLTSDLLGLATPNSIWIETSDTVSETGALAAQAYRASFGPKPGPVSLILPADAAWNEGGIVGAQVEPSPLEVVGSDKIKEAAAAIQIASNPIIIVNGNVLEAGGLEAAARLKASGVRIIADTFFTKMHRGANVFAPERLLYFAEGALGQLEGCDLLMCAGTQLPVAFFAYPGKPSSLVPEGCTTLDLGDVGSDSAATLSALADEIGAKTLAPVQVREIPNAPTGDLSIVTVAQSLSRHLPKQAIVCDDGVSNGYPCYLGTMQAEAHDWMMLTGGAIGDGLPMALGASIAAPERKVICLTGDGAGMYTNQGLWSLARENANVTVIVFVNHDYRILQIELMRTGAGEPGPTAQSMLSLGQPEIDWVKLSEGLGVPAVATNTAEAFDKALSDAIAAKGARLIAAILPG